MSSPLPWFAVLLAVCIGGCHRWVQLALAAQPGPPETHYQDNALSDSTLRLLSFGNAPLVADTLYLRAVSTFGERKQQQVDYPRFTKSLQQSVALAPKSVSPYLLAGTSVLVGGSEHADRLALLARGCQERPDVWQLPFYRGYHAFAVERDFDEAARNFVVAARQPGAPAFLGPLATRSAAQSTNPEAGLQLLDALAQTTDDDGVRETLAHRRRALLLECRLQRLQHCADTFAKRRKRPPSSMGELATFAESEPAGGCATLQANETGWWEPFATSLQDPLGGLFVINASRVVATEHERARLRLNLDTPAPEDKRQ